MKISLRDVTKKYGDLLVLNQLSLDLESPMTYCLMGPSGSGKTTLLRLLMGLETPDFGIIEGIDIKKVRAVFQEDRLCETFNALENVSLSCDQSLNTEQIKTEMLRLLPEEAIYRPVHTLSGGMKRRAAILRALLSPSQILIMDEPFTGLDPDTKLLVINYIKELSKQKLLIVTTHQEEDITLLDAVPIRMLSVG